MPEAFEPLVPLELLEPVLPDELLEPVELFEPLLFELFEPLLLLLLLLLAAGAQGGNMAAPALLPVPLVLPAPPDPLVAVVAAIVA